MPSFLGVPQGNEPECWRASIATLLQVDLDEIPPVHWDALPNWCSDHLSRLHGKFGVVFELFERSKLPPGYGTERWIAVLDVGKDDVSHAVVARGDQLIFDPDRRRLPQPLIRDGRPVDRLLYGFRIRHQP